MIDINTLRFAVQLNKLDNSQLPASPLVVEDLLDRLEAAERERDKWRDELDVERMRLAACGVAALGYFTDCAQEYKSASLEDVLRLRAKIEQMERQLLDRLEEAEQERDALRAKIEAMEKRLRLILEEPENTMSNSKALREMVRQARLALEESK